MSEENHRADPSRACLNALGATLMQPAGRGGFDPAIGIRCGGETVGKMTAVHLQAHGPIPASGGGVRFAPLIQHVHSAPRWSAKPVLRALWAVQASGRTGPRLAAGRWSDPDPAKSSGPSPPGIRDISGGLRVKQTAGLPIGFGLMGRHPWADPWALVGGQGARQGR